MGEILAGSLAPQPVARIRTQVRIQPVQRTTAAQSLPVHPLQPQHKAFRPAAAGGGHDAAGRGPHRYSAAGAQRRAAEPPLPCSGEPLLHPHRRPGGTLHSAHYSAFHFFASELPLRSAGQQWWFHVRSSGVRVCTATGATAAMRSAGGAPMDPLSKELQVRPSLLPSVCCGSAALSHSHDSGATQRMMGGAQFQDREPIYHDHMPPPSWGRGLYRHGDTMHVRWSSRAGAAPCHLRVPLTVCWHQGARVSELCVAPRAVAGTLYLDGAHVLRNISIGSEVLFSTLAPPLLLYRAPHMDLLWQRERPKEGEQLTFWGDSMLRHAAEEEDRHRHHRRAERDQ